MVTANLYDSKLIRELLLLTDAIRRARPRARISLECPYLPYARQDRVCAPGEALALHVMCQLINSQNYETVTVWDVHSTVALALLDRVINIPAAFFVKNVATPRMVLVAPDAGAVKRAEECAVATGCALVRAEKKRDPLTGEITGTVVHSDPIGDQDFLMVDDICDGGRTFIELAKVLRPLTEGKIFLYVTHGIMSKGMGVLREHIDDVHVANPFPGLTDYSKTGGL